MSLGRGWTQRWCYRVIMLQIVVITAWDSSHDGDFLKLFRSSRKSAIKWQSQKNLRVLELITSGNTATPLSPLLQKLESALENHVQKKITDQINIQNWWQIKYWKFQNLNFEFVYNFLKKIEKNYQNLRQKLVIRNWGTLVNILARFTKLQK